MMNVIEDLPAGVVGIAAHGKITHEDYQNVLSPMLETAIDANDKKINFLYVIESYDGADMEALWDDTKLGIRHWSDFNRIALVTDVDWIKNTTHMVGWMIPAEIKQFKLADIEAARNWVTVGN